MVQIGQFLEFVLPIPPCFLVDIFVWTDETYQIDAYKKTDFIQRINIQKQYYRRVGQADAKKKAYSNCLGLIGLNP